MQLRSIEVCCHCPIFHIFIVFVVLCTWLCLPLSKFKISVDRFVGKLDLTPLRAPILIEAHALVVCVVLFSLLPLRVCILRVISLTIRHLVLVMSLLPCQVHLPHHLSLRLCHVILLFLHLEHWVHFLGPLGSLHFLFGRGPFWVLEIVLVFTLKCEAGLKSG